MLGTLGCSSGAVGNVSPLRGCSAPVSAPTRGSLAGLVFPQMLF